MAVFFFTPPKRSDTLSIWDALVQPATFARPGGAGGEFRLRIICSARYARIPSIDMSWNVFLGSPSFALAFFARGLRPAKHSPRKKPRNESRAACSHPPSRGTTSEQLVNLQRRRLSFAVFFSPHQGRLPEVFNEDTLSPAAFVVLPVESSAMRAPRLSSKPLGTTHTPAQTSDSTRSHEVL